MNHGQYELENEMHERYCHLRVRGYSQCKAYQRAQEINIGDEDKPVSVGVARTAGWRLEKNDEVRMRIKRLKRLRLRRFRNEEKALTRAYQKAVDNETYSPQAHLRAIEGYAKFIGKVTETVNHNHSGNVSLNVEFE